MRPTVSPLNITINPSAPTGPFDGVDLSPERVDYLLNRYRRKLAEPHATPVCEIAAHRFAELIDRVTASVAA